MREKAVRERSVCGEVCSEGEGSEGEVSVWGGIAVRERSVCGEVCSEGETHRQFCWRLLFSPGDL